MYDLLGRRQTQLDAKGQTITFSYNAVNMLEVVTYPGSKTITYRALQQNNFRLRDLSAFGGL
jgi:uncharacterized protein RhaS with RHS repeats